MEEILNLKDVKDYMFGYYIVSKIYELRNYFHLKDDPIYYNDLILNKKILYLIDEINFVYIKDVGILDDIKEIKKIGNLLNFQVYYDQYHDENTVTLVSKEKQNVDIKIIF